MIPYSIIIFSEDITTMANFPSKPQATLYPPVGLSWHGRFTLISLEVEKFVTHTVRLKYYTGRNSVQRCWHKKYTVSSPLLVPHTFLRFWGFSHQPVPYNVRLFRDSWGHSLYIAGQHSVASIPHSAARTGKNSVLRNDAYG